MYAAILELDGETEKNYNKSKDLSHAVGLWARIDVTNMIQTMLELGLLCSLQ
jgi:hypothetical protein